MKRNRTDKIVDIAIYVFLMVVGIITLYPFLNVLAISFNNANDTVAGGIYLWPRQFTFANYQKVFTYPNLIRAAINSVIRTLVGTSLSVVATAAIAYTLSRKDFVARKFFTFLFVITMYVSGGLVPSYLLMRDLHLFNNFLVYILPSLVWPFCIFLMRSYIEGIPFSLQESAMIDGANDFVIFVKIIFPLCIPSLATIALFYAVSNWNSWFDTYLYCSSNANLTTLQYELQKIVQSLSTSKPTNSINSNAVVVTPQSVQMAITIVVVTPILCVYPSLQKYFVSGMTLGAVKG